MTIGDWLTLLAIALTVTAGAGGVVYRLGRLTRAVDDLAARVSRVETRLDRPRRLQWECCGIRQAVCRLAGGYPPRSSGVARVKGPGNRLPNCPGALLFPPPVCYSKNYGNR